MGFGCLSRWGRGHVEGYGLEIGHLLRFSIFAKGDKTEWRASLKAYEFGIFPDLETAVTAVEREVRDEMAFALECWMKFKDSLPAQRRYGRKR